MSVGDEVTKRHLFCLPNSVRERHHVVNHAGGRVPHPSKRNSGYIGAVRRTLVSLYWMMYILCNNQCYVKLGYLVMKSII